MLSEIMILVDDTPLFSFQYPNDPISMEGLLSIARTLGWLAHPHIALGGASSSRASTPPKPRPTSSPSSRSTSTSERKKARARRSNIAAQHRVAGKQQH